MIIVICTKITTTEIEDVFKYPPARLVVKCDSVEEALALLSKSRQLDPIVTFAPTADVLDRVTSNFHGADRRTLVVIYGDAEDQAVSMQSYLLEACRNLIGPAKDRAD